MKRVMSIILCLTMLFVMAAVPALASETDGGQWITFFSEDFSGYNEPYSLDQERTYTNAKSYIWYGSSSMVTNAVSAYDDNNALKIKRDGKGDRRILFEFNEHLSGQIEISCRMLATAIYNKGAFIEVVGENENGEFVVNTTGVTDCTHITGTYYQNNALKTGYNGNAAAGSETKTWQADEWLNVKYVIDTVSGNVTATYSSANIAEFNETFTGTAELPDVVGIAFRSATENAFDLYIDDITVKYYEIPATDIDFDFSNISDESINGVISPLNLIKQFTDDEGKLWYITWTSSNSEIINPDTGAVAAGAIDERVKLTAIFTNSGSGGENEITTSKNFNIKVLAAGTYHVKEDFDAAGDYSGHNAIKNYTENYNLTWSIKNAKNEDTELIKYMNANISQDPEDPQDKVLKLYRKASPTSQPDIQRVWAQIKDTSQLNEKVYVGMRVLREKSTAHTEIYAYDTTGETRLMRVRFNTDDTITYYYDEGLESKGTSTIKAPSGKWFDFTLELDMEKGCYNIYLDGQSIVQGSPAMQASDNGFGGLVFDVLRGIYEDETTIYFDDLMVRTPSGFPYLIAGYNFTDASGKYPTESMVEGGKLKSIDMRKMSTVDAGSEPTLYICFFKEELLYDVISAQLTENAPLGGFEVALNKDLPENPLDYNLKVFVFSKELVPLMESSTYEPYEAIPTIFVAGDSIAKSYSETEYPMTGYAQVLSENFDGNINIENHAEGSRSSKSFIEEGRLSKILDNMYWGDYLFIQFGHNDDKTEDGRYTDPNGDKNTEGSFKYYLMQYIDGARAKGATPVLITPPGDNSLEQNGDDKPLMKYVAPMRALAQEEGVLLVDLYADWKEFVNNRPVVNGNKIDSRNYYMYLYSDDCRFVNDEAFKASKYHEDNITTENMHKSLFKYYFDDDTTRFVHADGTHFNAYTARVAAKFIAERLKAFNIGLSENVIETEELTWPWNGYETFGTKTYERD